jgi:hypothetical protein
VKYTDDHALLAREAKEIQDIINRLIKYSEMLGLARNVKETKVMRISRQSSRVSIIMDKNNLIYSPQYSSLKLLSMNTKY